MAALAAFILAAAPVTAAAPRPDAPTYSSSASATASVTIVRAERIGALDQPASVVRNVRREAGKIAVDFY